MSQVTSVINYSIDFLMTTYIKVTLPKLVDCQQEKIKYIENYTQCPKKPRTVQ